MKKIYFLFILCCLNYAAFATQYFPSSVTAPYAGTAQTVCKGSLNIATTITYSVCGTSSGTALQTLTVTPTWYLNGALVYTGATFVSVSGGGTITLAAGSFTYSTAGSFTGANGLKCTLTWPTAAPGGCTAGTTVTGPATNVTVNPLPAPITGITRVCTAMTTSLSDTTAGGTWSSGTTTVATVDPGTGVVSGIVLGTAPITYSLPTTCLVTTTVTVTHPPSAISGLNMVCDGQTITLSDNFAGGYWSSSNSSLATVSSSTGVVTGASLGLPVISYTMGSACFAVMSVTVNPLSPITGADSICHGSTTYLADVVGSGTWTSSLPAIASIGSLTGFVTGVSTTTGVTHITYTTPLGCITTSTMTVIAIPPAITGTMSVCPGATTTLHNATGGGIWSSDNNAVATVSTSSGTGTVHGVFADTTHIMYTVRPGCFVSALVTVDPLPAPITGNDAICATLTDSLYDASAGGAWTTTTPTLATISASGVVTAIEQGNAVIVYTLPLTGCKITDVIAIQPLPVPVISYNWGSSSFDVNNTYVTYQWYDSLSGLIPGATAPTLAALYTEYYYVVVTDSFGCTGTSALFEFNTSLLGVKAPANTPLIKIYPNPATTTVYIESTVNVRAVVASIDGKKQLEQANAKEIDVSRLADGMYFITLYDDNQQVITVRKLIKQ